VNRCLKIVPALVLSGLALAAFGSPKGHSSTESGRTDGFGLIVGDVGPCTAKRFDASPANPLIVILTKNARTFDAYNISADRGTTSYHFDVPVGDYKLTTTWPRSKVFSVQVKLGKTSKVNVAVSCGTTVI
jgi:hypothetical protein